MSQDLIENKKKFSQKTFWILALSSLVCLFNQLADQDYSTLHLTFKETLSTPDHYSEFEFYYNTISSISYSFNIILILFSGAICDKYSPRIIVLGTSILSMLGSFIIILSLRFLSLKLLVVGWIAQNIAAQNLVMAINLFINQYYEKNQLAFIGGIIGTMMQLGRAGSMNLQPHISQNYGFLTSILLNQFATVAQLILALVVFNKDSQIDQEMKQSADQQIKEIENMAKAVTTGQNHSSTLKLYLSQQYYIIQQFSGSYWIFCFTSSLFMFTLNQLNNLLPQFFVDKWKWDNMHSNQVLSLLIVPSFFNFFVGKVIDYTGHYLILFFISTIIQFVCNGLLTIMNPEIVLVFMGVGVCIRSCTFFPILSQYIKPQDQGKAVSLTKSIRDIIGFFSMLLISKIIADTQSYAIPMQILLYISLSLVFTSGFLMIKDWKSLQEQVLLQSKIQKIQGEK